jgi:hypothetical protein
MLTVVLHFVFSALPVGRSSPSRCPNHGLSLVLQSGTQDGRLGSLFSLEHFAGLDDRSLSCELNVLRRASSEVSSIAAAPVVSLKWPSHLNMHSLPWFCCLELLDSSRFFHLGELYVRKIGSSDGTKCNFRSAHNLGNAYLRTPLSLTHWGIKKCMRTSKDYNVETTSHATGDTPS